ncbi:hypothetical protein MES5069_440029 [Mesorhizobium escarrei]|uniref:Uncharacterized protein n=1 Tax=Mesorhizobium escarrei TaxID=666018 RepID=A0ABN8K536_9HYPH|nr:hypothetical protein MES5069_440029 [Mesorhizobium escarrei]
MVERAFRQAGLADDVVHRRVVVAMLEEKPLGAVEELGGSYLRRLYHSGQIEPHKVQVEQEEHEPELYATFIDRRSV